MDRKDTRFMFLSVRGEVSLDIFRKCLVISAICLEHSAMFRALVIAVSENKAGGIGALIPPLDLGAKR